MKGPNAIAKIFRLFIAQPKGKDASKVMAARPACIPASVLKMREGAMEKPAIKTEKDLQEEMGGAGVYSVDLNKSFLLAKPEWKYDEAPEIFDGKVYAYSSSM